MAEIKDLRGLGKCDLIRGSSQPGCPQFLLRWWFKQGMNFQIAVKILGEDFFREGSHVDDFFGSKWVETIT